jgi:hypothetical protein
MTKAQVLDLYFIENRHKLLEVAAFLDRVDRAEGKADFRLEALRRALPVLSKGRGARAKRLLLALSDHSRAPIPKATTKSACGACPVPPQSAQA